jgi:hypothetical protein
MNYNLLTETASQQDTNPGAYGVGDMHVDPETGELVRDEDDEDENNDRKKEMRGNIALNIQEDEDFGLDMDVDDPAYESYLSSLIDRYLENLTPDEIMALTNSAPFKSTLDSWASRA